MRRLKGWLGISKTGWFLLVFGLFLQKEIANRFIQTQSSFIPLFISLGNVSKRGGCVADGVLISHIAVPSLNKDIATFIL